MEIKYYIDKTSPAEHSLKRNIVPDAKRTENFTSLPWRTQSASFWRHLPYSSILQKAENKFVFAKKCFHQFPTYYFSAEFIQQ